MANDEASGVTIEELSTAVDLPIRTIRYYIAEGLIAGPKGRGTAALYSDEHQLRLRLIRRLANERLPLAEIKTRLAGLSAVDVAALLQREESRSVEIELARSAPSPKDYIAALLRNARATGEKPPFRAPMSLWAPSPNPARAIEESPAPFVSSDASLKDPNALDEAMSLLEPDSSDVVGSSVMRTSNTTISCWEHWELAPGIVLQIRSDARKANRDLIDRLLRLAEHPRPHQPPSQR